MSMNREGAGMSRVADRRLKWEEQWEKWEGWTDEAGMGQS